jgi:hypothetical protein
MKVVFEKPPNFDAIAAVFPVGGKAVFFCFGSIIYNPNGAVLTDALIAHEDIHRQQQGDDPLGWWEKYLADKKFRLEQEVPAHRAEYEAFCKEQYSKGIHDRVARRLYLKDCARRLSSPLYGNMVSATRAKWMMKLNT